MDTENPKDLDYITLEEYLEIEKVKGYSVEPEDHSYLDMEAPSTKLLPALLLCHGGDLNYGAEANIDGTLVSKLIKSIVKQAGTIEKDTNGLYTGIELRIGVLTNDQSLFDKGSVFRQTLAKYQGKNTDTITIGMLIPSLCHYDKHNKHMVVATFLNSAYKNTWYSGRHAVVLSDMALIQPKEISEAVLRLVDKSIAIERSPLAPSPIFAPFRSTEAFVNESKHSTRNSSPDLSFEIYGAWDYFHMEALNLFATMWGQPRTAMEEAEFLLKPVSMLQMSVET